MKWSFAWKCDALPSNFRVKSVRSQYNLTRWGISPHSIFRNGVNGSFAPIGWPRKGGRNSDSTIQAKESPTCFLSGEQHTPATGVNKCSNPDEGTLNEVSSLANEKFISSRNTYGAKGKAVRVSVGVFSHQNLVYFYTKLEAQYNYVLENPIELHSIVFVGRIIFRCIGLHIK